MYMEKEVCIFLALGVGDLMGKQLHVAQECSHHTEKQPNQGIDDNGSQAVVKLFPIYDAILPET